MDIQTETTVPARIQSDDASCPTCRSRHGQSLPRGVVNPARRSMGHAMYATDTGATAVCILSTGRGT